MLILKYDQQNKEQLDEYIKTVTKQRNDLSTCLLYTSGRNSMSRH